MLEFKWAVYDEAEWPRDPCLSVPIMPWCLTDYLELLSEPSSAQQRLLCLSRAEASPDSTKSNMNQE